MKRKLDKINLKFPHMLTGNELMDFHQKKLDEKERLENEKKLKKENRD